MPNTNEVAKGKEIKPLSELKISPAPWKVDKDADGWNIVRDANGKYAATPDGDEETEAISNASLISASPKLYEASYDVVTYCENNHLVPSEQFRPVLARLRAALAEAAGEEVSDGK